MVQFTLNFFIWTLLLLTFSVASVTSFVNYETHILDSTATYSQNDSSIHIFCKKDNPKLLSKVWAQSYIKFENISNTYHLLDGISPAKVYEKFLTTSKLWPIFSVNIYNYGNVRYIPYFDSYCFTIVSEIPFRFVYHVTGKSWKKIPPKSINSTNQR